MSKNRIKITPAPAITTRAQMETLVGEIAALKNEQRRHNANMDTAITKARSAYEELLSAIDTELATKLDQAHAWADAHQAEFGKLKSLDMIHGVVGWRIGNPTLKPMKGWTWDRVLEKLESVMWGGSFVRTKTEIDKASLLADRVKLGDQLETVGVRVVQEESFFVDPKLTSVEDRETKAA